MNNVHTRQNMSNSSVSKLTTSHRLSNSDSDSNDSSEDQDNEDILIKASDLIYQPESNRRKWLLKRGKGHMIDLDDEELKMLRECFDSLDDDGSQSIGVEELEDPLIALGLVDNRQQVQQIV